MTSNKRQRELARAKYERQQERRASQAHSRRTRQRIIAIVTVAVLVVGALVWAGLSLRPDDTVAEAPVPTETGPAPAETSAAPVAACAEPGTPRADDLTWDTAPTGEPTSGTLTLTTNCGDIVIDVLADAAPRTATSAKFLADEGFYDATSCHRLTTEGIFVLQCGDPAGNGTGGPGYTLPDENLPAADGVNYPAGTVAMANAGPGTSGSQFFLVYQDTTLPPAYTVWGQVTQGLDLLTSVAQAGVQGGATDGAPNQPVFIEKATFSGG